MDWSIKLSKVYFINHNHILSDVINNFEHAEDYLSADAVVGWNDILENERNIILESNFIGKVTIIMQHGIGASREYVPPVNTPFIAEKIMV